jgi:TctA family transporter
MSQGSPMIFFASPISATLVIASILLTVWPLLGSYLRGRRSGPTKEAPVAP